jgi:glutathione S-transferase
MAEGGSMAANGYTLVIGDKNLSSWSLRPWLALKQCGIPFAEERVRLRQPESKAAILRHSPSGKVPAFKTEWGVIWDSLAILEFLAERHAECALWPQEVEARAAARSISAEMHAGFFTLRNEMSMDLLGRLKSPPIEGALEADIRRIVAIWKDTRAHFGTGGPFLFGAFSNADAMYAPVATRFRTYGVDLARFGDDGTAAS